MADHLAQCSVAHSRPGGRVREAKTGGQDPRNLDTQKQTNIHLFHAQRNKSLLQRQDRAREVDEDRNLPAYH